MFLKRSPVPTDSPDLAELLQTALDQSVAGPSWLNERRQAAFDRLHEQELPTTEPEEWRYSKIEDFDPSSYSVSHNTVAAQLDEGEFDQALRSLLQEIGDRAGLVVLRNGQVVYEKGFEGTAKGVRFGVVAEDSNDATNSVDSLVYQSALSTGDYFAELSTIATTTPVILDVPDGVVIEQPFVVASFTDSENGLVGTRVSIRIGQDAQASIVEVNAGADVPALVLPVTEVQLARAGRLFYSAVQDLPDTVWSIGTFAATVDTEATLTADVAAFGGDYSRLRMDCRLIGRGAHGNLSSVYFGNAQQSIDLRTFQDHEAPDTTSNLMFKGAVADSSRSVYTGLIRIHPEGNGSRAYQTNRNIKLSDDAWAESVPNLEIQHNDVLCSHASTVGPVDEDQLFYLETRGVPSAIAERLVVGGFFSEVLTNLAVPQLQNLLEARVGQLLDQLETSAPAVSSGAVE